MLLSLNFSFSSFGGFPSEAYFIKNAGGFFEEKIIGFAFTQDSFVFAYRIGTMAFSYRKTCKPDTLLDQVRQLFEYTLEHVNELGIGVL